MTLPEEVRRAYEHILELGDWYDRQGNPITDAQYWFECMSNEDYRHVGVDMVGSYRISTVWLGQDHNRSRRDGPVPLIFETMVTGDDDRRFYRWATDAEAIAGHANVVATIRETGTYPPDDLFGDEP